MKKLIVVTTLAWAFTFLCSSSLKAQGKAVALETIGAVSGVAMYNTYIAIGCIADGFTDDGYDAAYIISLMDEQIAILEEIGKSFDTLIESGFLTDPADLEFAVEIKIALGYLKAEAEGLKELVGGGTETKYSENRDYAWKKIAELLNLE